MRKISLLILSVVLMSGCGDKESSLVTQIKQSKSFYKCVMYESGKLNSITPNLEKMIESKCIDQHPLNNPISTCVLSKDSVMWWGKDKLVCE